MTPFILALVGLRLLAVYCFVQSIPLFCAFGILGTFSRPQYPDPLGLFGPPALTTALLPGASLLLVAILLYVFSRPLARRLAGPQAAGDTGSVGTLDQFQVAAFAVAGILILTFALPGVFRAFGSVVDLAHYKKEGGVVSLRDSYHTWLSFIGVLLQISIGLVLLLNPAGFRNAWNWLRTART